MVRQLHQMMAHGRHHLFPRQSPLLLLGDLRARCG